MDLDQFKDVNDSRGHRAGDELPLGARAAPAGTAARNGRCRPTGGDEFAVLLPHTDAEQAQDVAADLLDAIRSQTFVVGGSPLRITASVGMALFPDHAVVAGELLSRADLAMYRAKDEGRDRSCLYAPDGDWQAQIGVENRLASAGPRSPETAGSSCTPSQSWISATDGSPNTSCCFVW